MYYELIWAMGALCDRHFYLGYMKKKNQNKIFTIFLQSNTI